jgi:hypothetical protein
MVISYFRLSHPKPPPSVWPATEGARKTGKIYFTRDPSSFFIMGEAMISSPG